MSNVILTQPKSRANGLLRGLARRWRQRRNAAKTRNAATVTASREAIELLFREWLAICDALREMDDDGWSDPQYARALISERVHFESLLQQARSLRRKGLPV